jgi:predicted house-cleaning noncanonical NTP pyrophosphatase (MazG superfamily)
MINVTNKLVRDKIPEIIASQGGTCDIEILGEQEYKEALVLKMKEELAEYDNGKFPEELVDVYEVLIALVNASGYDMKTLDKMAIEKRKKNGGFEDRIFMRSYNERGYLR